MDITNKTENKCGYCIVGILGVSLSGEHLVCRNCGRITILDKLRLPRGNKKNIFP